MAHTTHDIGDTKVLTGTFRNASGALANPTTVTLRVRKPDGTTSTVSNSNSSTGIYTASVPLDQSGVWRYKWWGTGAVAEAGEGWFTVRRERVAAA